MSNALHRKANKTDVEVSISQKADAGILSNLELALQNKVETDLFEKQINHLLDNRVERQDLFALKEMISLKAERQN